MHSRYTSLQRVLGHLHVWLDQAHPKHAQEIRVSDSHLTQRAAHRGPGGLKLVRATLSLPHLYPQVDPQMPGRVIHKTSPKGTTFSRRFIPGGTVVTSGIYLQDTDSKIFPEPFIFGTERWLCDADTYKMRDKQMQSFSRGSRGCIGINLGYATAVRGADGGTYHGRGYALV